MPLTISAETPPLMVDDDGVMRVTRTRVTLDSLVIAFQEGATPEEITQQYPTVGLVDVYAVIAYYLKHRQTVDEYLRTRAGKSAQIRREDEARWPAIGLRDRLLARRNAAESGSSG